MKKQFADTMITKKLSRMRNRTAAASPRNMISERQRAAQIAAWIETPSMVMQSTASAKRLAAAARTKANREREMKLRQCEHLTTQTHAYANRVNQVTPSRVVHKMERR